MIGIQVHGYFKVSGFVNDYAIILDFFGNLMRTSLLE